MPASSQKKVRYGLDDLVHIFVLLPLSPHPIWKKWPQILIAHQKEGVEGEKNVQLAAKKLEDLVHIFGLWNECKISW